MHVARLNKVTAGAAGVSITARPKSTQNQRDDAVLLYSRLSILPIGGTGMQKKIFWSTVTLLGLVADFSLPFWWAVAATVPILYVSWWVAYRSDWF